MRLVTGEDHPHGTNDDRPWTGTSSKTGRLMQGMTRRNVEIFQIIRQFSSARLHGLMLIVHPQPLKVPAQYSAWKILVAGSLVGRGRIRDTLMLPVSLELNGFYPSHLFTLEQPSNTQQRSREGSCVSAVDCHEARDFQNPVRLLY